MKETEKQLNLVSKANSEAQLTGLDLALVVHSSVKPVCADSQKFAERLFRWLDPASFP
jgi:hypothetical protein